VVAVVVVVVYSSENPNARRGRQFQYTLKFNGCILASYSLIHCHLTPSTFDLCRSLKLSVTPVIIIFRMKQSAQRRREHCALAVVRGAKNFAPPQTPFPGAQDGQNLISWRWSLPLAIDPVW